MRILAFLVIIALLSSCARVINQTPIEKDKEGLYAVLPLENYTETPYAGYRVSSIIEGVLASKGYKLIDRVWGYSEKEYSKEDIERLKEEAVKRGARYLIHGSVNEI
ncbi:hypothetical protein [Thermocrinis sp.]